MLSVEIVGGLISFHTKWGVNKLKAFFTKQFTKQPNAEIYLTRINYLIWTIRLSWWLFIALNLIFLLKKV
jgi:hypothetical protein